MLCFRHFGDLGNVEEDKSGEVTLRMEDLLVSLLGPFSILGRGVVVSIVKLVVHLQRTTLPVCNE